MRATARQRRLRPHRTTILAKNTSAPPGRYQLAADLPSHSINPHPSPGAAISPCRRPDSSRPSAGQLGLGSGPRLRSALGSPVRAGGTGGRQAGRVSGAANDRARLAAPSASRACPTAPPPQVSTTWRAIATSSARPEPLRCRPSRSFRSGIRTVITCTNSLPPSRGPRPFTLDRPAHW